MFEFAYRHLNHVIAALLFVSRLGDIGSTYLITPTLRLEANPIVRRLGWRFAIATLAVCVVPYFSVPLGVMMLVPSLMISASNSARVWMARTLGEMETKALMVGIAGRSRLSHALAAVLASAAFSALLGVVVLLFYPDAGEDWGFWIGAGIIVYAASIAIYGTLYMRRLFREAARQEATTVSS